MELKKSSIKYFTFIISEHSDVLHKYSYIENYYTWPIHEVIKSGYTPIVISRNYHNTISDPNLPKGVLVYDFKNWCNYLFLILKYRFRSNSFYCNSVSYMSFLPAFISNKTIFMGHTQPKRQTLFKQKVFNFIMNRFSKIRLNNVSEQDFLIKQGVLESKLFVIPLPISFEVFKLHQDVKKTHDILLFGAISKVKNISTINKAISIVIEKYPHARINIFGKESDYHLNDDVYYNRNNNNYDLHGFVQQSDYLGKELNKSSVYVNSSIMEGQCVAVFNAALTGNALCLPKIMSFTEVFKDCALFHEVNDYEQLAKNVIFFLENEDERKKCNLRAIEMIKDNYDIKVIEHKMRDLLTF